jgi:hypothetical protein
VSAGPSAGVGTTVAAGTGPGFAIISAGRPNKGAAGTGAGFAITSAGRPNKGADSPGAGLEERTGAEFAAWLVSGAGELLNKGLREKVKMAIAVKKDTAEIAMNSKRAFGVKPRLG